MHHSFEEWSWSTVIFSSQRELDSVPNMNSLVKLSYILCQFLLSWAELRKCTPNILMENYDHLSQLINSILPHKIWLFEKFIFELKGFPHKSKINFILVRQLKSLKKMVVLSKKFMILISQYLYTFNPHISINKKCKQLSHNNP